MAFKNIFFDWGGVLIENPREKIINYCSQRLGLEPETFVTLYKKYDALFSKNEIEESALWRGICKDAGIKNVLQASLWSEAFQAAYTPRAEMFDLVRDLRKQKYKVGLLSNTELPAADLLLDYHHHEFDSLTFSCIVGSMKPEKEIYQHALKSLNALAHEAVFIDDVNEYVESAQRTGLKGILYQSYEQAKNDLKRLGVRIE